MRIDALFLSLLVAFFAACSTSPKIPDKSTNEPPQTYSVQVGSFKNPNNAWRFVDILNQKGLDAFLFKSKQTYKVRFGNYTTKAEATKAAKALKTQGFFDDFFVVAPVRKRPEESSLRLNLYDSSYGYIGVPYKWGGKDANGFDCSGLTHTIYRLNGISIPRTSLEQFRAGRFVSKQNLRIGDLVFFATKRKQINHVGIYVGNDTFIHAPSRGKTVREANLNADFWKKTYKGSRRFF